MRGGHWKEVKPEELKRRDDAQILSAPVLSGPAESEKIESEGHAVTGSQESGDRSGPSAGPPKVVRLERRQELEHRLKGSPTDLDAFMELGRIYRAEQRPADARRVFQQALQVFPDDQQLLWEYEEAVLARSTAAAA